GGLLQILAHLIELGLADHLVDAALELAREGARLANPEPGNAQGARQVLRPDYDERDDPDQHQFRPADVKQHRPPENQKTTSSSSARRAIYLRKARHRQSRAAHCVLRDGAPRLLRMT